MAAVWLHATNLSSRLHGTASPKERHWPQACTPASSMDSSHERTCSAKEQQGHRSARKRSQERLCSATTPLPTTYIQQRTRSGGGSEAVARSTSSSKLGDTMPTFVEADVSVSKLHADHQATSRELSQEHSFSTGRQGHRASFRERSKEHLRSATERQGHRSHSRELSQERMCSSILRRVCSPQRTPSPIELHKLSGGSRYFADLV